MKAFYRKPNDNSMEALEDSDIINNNALDQSNQQSKQSQFSFNRPTTKRVQDQHLHQKYLQIYNDLKIMNHIDLVDLFLEELEEGEKSKKQIWKLKNKVQSLQEQLNETKQALKKKREAVNILCETETKNLQIIEKLENKLSKKNQYSRDTYYEKKYQQLSIYMNQYIRNINLAQEEFKKVYNTQKNDNSRLFDQVEQLRKEYEALANKYHVSQQKYKRSQQDIKQLVQEKRAYQQKINHLQQQNDILSKQIEIFQQNIRITDRLQVNFSKQQCQLSSDLDFIRERINENEHISKDLIEKLQENQSNYQKINKQKILAFQSLNRAKQKCSGLQAQIQNMKKRNQQLEQDIAVLHKQKKFILSQRDQLEDDLIQQRLQKEAIRKQLLGLGQKVRYMQSTYKRQIEQSEKIKGQLHKFWENKEKKQTAIKQIGHKRVLSQIKNNQNSQTTITLSEKQSKLSIWNKKNEQEASLQSLHMNNQNERLSLNQKQNDYSQDNQDSLCD